MRHATLTSDVPPNRPIDCGCSVRRSWRRRAAAAAAVTVVFGTSLALAAPPDGFADLVDQVKPAVVNIASSEKVARPERGGRQFEIPPNLRGTPFEEFLRKYFDQRGDDNGAEPERPMTALGSGFLIDPAGYVVTNNHVIQNASKIQVTLADGRKLAAQIVGKDEKTDLALLKVDAGSALPSVSWGDSDKARVGDWVLAIGNPFGLGGTVTAGIISARGRDIQSGPFDDFLQIDAPINQGNSGGPSFDRTGKVIGINAAIFSPSGGSIGIGFAVPSSVAKPIVDQLRERGRIDRGWLGVSIQSMNKEIADGLGLESEKGALVSSVTPNGPAAKAGLRQGDVIRSVSGQPILAARDLARVIAAAGPGTTVTLTIWRERAETSMTVPLGLLPDEPKQSSNETPPAQRNPTAATASILGLSLAPLTQAAREEFKVPERSKGVLVTAVKPDSNAGEAGLAPGDVIVKVGDKTITTPQQVVDAVKGTPDRTSVLFLVERGGNPRFVGLPVHEG